MKPAGRRLSPGFFGRSLVSLLLGLLLGVLFHYMLYRLSLPSKPFIYVSF